MGADVRHTEGVGKRDRVALAPDGVRAAVEGYFSEQEGRRVANVYTRKDGVPAMREAFAEAGVARQAIRWSAQERCHKLVMGEASEGDLLGALRCLERYGEGSPGHAAWLAEQGKTTAADVGRVESAPARTPEGVRGAVDRFFTAGEGRPDNLVANVYTRKDGVPAMRDAFTEAGIGRQAIRWSAQDRCHKLVMGGLSESDLLRALPCLERYGEGSPGQAAWRAEQGRERAVETAMETRLKGAGRRDPLEEARVGAPKAGGERAATSTARSPASESVPAWCDQRLLFVPRSEREAFDRTVLEKQATFRYDRSIPNGFGGRGAFILTGGEVGDFARWRTAESYSRFVSEHAGGEMEGERLRSVARSVAGAWDGHPFARYLGRGVMLPKDEDGSRLVIEGGVDRGGRRIVGLETADVQTVRDLAARTAQSIAFLSRKEDAIRFGIAVSSDPGWRARYEGACASPDAEGETEKLRREFGALDFSVKRELGTMRDGDRAVAGGLSAEETGEMASLRRGYRYLAGRHRELTGEDVGVTVSGLKRAVDEARKPEFDTSAKELEGDPARAAAAFRRRTGEPAGLER